jgi:phasin family protein
MEKISDISEEFVNFGKDNFDAFIKASQIWTEGVQVLAKDFITTAQAQLDETMATVTSFTSAKSVKELLDLRTAPAGNPVEKAIAETNRLISASTRLVTDTLAPLVARLTLASGTIAPAA